MKICITSKGQDLESVVDARFGRCAYFVFVDTETMDFEAIENQNTKAMGGAGVQSGKTVSDNGAGYLLTGNVGPNAFNTLNAADIKVVTGVSGKLKDVVEKFKAGEYKEIDSANVEPHFGMKGES